MAAVTGLAVALSAGSDRPGPAQPCSLAVAFRQQVQGQAVSMEASVHSAPGRLCFQLALVSWQSGLG